MWNSGGKRHSGVICVLATGTLLAVVPARAEPESETLLLVKATEENRRHGEGDLVELKDRRLCFIYTRYTAGWRDAHNADLVMRTSSDRGKTWTEPQVLVSRSEGMKNVMSASILRLRSGELLLFYLRKNSLNDCQLYVRRSTDEFRTLGAPVRVSIDDGYVVCHNDRAVQLSDGRIVLPTNAHTIYKNVNGKREPEFFRSGAAKVYYSDDEGRTWRGDAGRIAPRSTTQHEPGLVELRDGRLWMYMRTTQGAIYGCYSSDRGVHWTEPEPTPLKSPEAPATIKRIPWTGDLLCVWNDHTGYHALPRTIRSPLCLAISKDDGQTWGKPRVLEAAPPDDGWRSVARSYYSYTSMTFVKDRVILSYWDTENRTHQDRWYSLKVVAFNHEWLYWE